MVEAWEIIFFSILSASLLHIKNSMGLLTRSECFVLRCRISHDDFLASFPRTVAQMTHWDRGNWSVSGHCMKPNFKELSMYLTSECRHFFFCVLVVFPSFCTSWRSLCRLEVDESFFVASQTHTHTFNTRFLNTKVKQSPLSLFHIKI